MELPIEIGLLGNNKIGKTNIYNLYNGNEFNDTELTTIDAEYYTNDIDINFGKIQKKMKIIVWDTPGQERFLLTTINLAKNFLGLIFIYSITDRKSFTDIEKMIRKYNEIKINSNIPLILIGNKCDLENIRKVSKEEGENIAKKYKMKFFECSAKNDININESFKTIVDDIVTIFYDQLLNKDESEHQRIKILKFDDGIYEGETNNCIKDGYGTMKYNNGEKYEGHWKNDLREGKGKLFFSKGYYDCNWINNFQNGYGKIYYDNNKILQINFENGKREGVGIIHLNNNEILEINFKDDCIIDCTINYEDGSKLIGICDNNFNLIKGKIEYSNGDIYEGELNEIGLKNGKGIMKYNNGKIYDGNWENNKKNGNGLLCCNNEDYEKIINARISEININNIFKLKLNDSFYEGEFVNDLREGKGILFNKYGDHYLNNNLIYYGNFRNDNKYGYGCVYFEDEYYFRCYWKNNNTVNEFKEGLFHLSNSMEFIKINYTTSQWINFIKEKLSLWKNKKQSFQKTKIR